MNKSEMKSNPFDVLTQSAIELARDSISFNARFRNTEYMNIQNIDNMRAYFKRLEDQFNILSELSQQDVNTLRSMAYCNNDDNLERLNNVLFTEFERIRTEYSESFPFISIEFEKFTLGEDSKEFKRREVLRNICDSDNRISLNFLGSCSDYLIHGESYCKRNWNYIFSDEYCNTIRSILNNYNIQEWELDYMSSYIRHR